MTWKRIGGGTFLMEGRRFPCDDQYEEIGTGKRITIYSKEEHHFDMPFEIGSVEWLYALPGVSKHPGRRHDDAD